MGRGEGALVAVVSREQGRIYRLRGGRLVDVADHYEEQPRRHDQGGWSQGRFQRHIENLARSTCAPSRTTSTGRFAVVPQQSIVVVCAEEIRNGVLRAAVDTRLATPSSAGSRRRRTRPRRTFWRLRCPSSSTAASDEEKQAVERWREEAGRGGRASSGWAETLEAASDGRVELLLSQHGSDREAWQCPECGRASSAGGRCPLDGTEMDERAEGLDLAVHQTLAHGGSGLVGAPPPGPRAGRGHRRAPSLLAV